MKKFFKLALAATMLVFLSACSNPFGGNQSLLDTGHQPGTPDGGNSSRILDAGKGSEMVVGSSQQVTTQNGRFKLQASVSAATNSLYIETPTRHFRIFSNVQGEFLSEGGGL